MVINAFICWCLLFGLLRSNKMYKQGNTARVSTVAVNSPPITTVASGLCTSAPAPLLSAMGRKPRDATEAVIRIGRNLASVAFTTISFTGDSSVVLKRTISVINTIPFNTATPNKAMKPTPAEILNGISLSHKLNTPPVADNGMAEKMSNPYLILLKAK